MLAINTSLWQMKMCACNVVCLMQYIMQMRIAYNSCQVTAQKYDRKMQWENVLVLAITVAVAVDVLSCSTVWFHAVYPKLFK